MSLKWRLALTYLLAVSLALLASAFLINSLVTSHYLFERRVGLLAQANIVADLASRVRHEAVTNVFEQTGPSPSRLVGDQLEAAIVKEWQGRLERILPAIDGLAVQLQARALIVDGQGRVILDTHDSDSLLGQIIAHPEIQTALTGQDNAQQHVLPGRERVLYAAVPVVQEKVVVGAVLLSAPLADLYAQVAVLRTKVVTIFAFVGLVVALLSVAVALQISKPLHELTEGAQAIAGGDFSHRVKITRGDEIGHLASSFNRMAERLAEEDRLRHSFIADASHELRTPLSSIKALADSLLSAPDPSRQEYRELLTDIDNEIERMNRLVTQLLRLAHLEADTPGWQPQPTDLAVLAADAVNRLWDMAGQAGVALQLAAEPAVATVDADLFLQVFLNLGENAIRHTPAGGRVTISTWRAGATALVTVSDTGAGIPAEQRERVFERFVRLDHSRSRSSGGFGLGLAIVRRIVQLHGGQITISDAPGGGSVFTVEVPGGEEEAGLTGS